MLRKILESKLGPMTNSQFRELLDLVTSDIKANRIAYSRRTIPADVVEIAEITWGILQRVA